MGSFMQQQLCFLLLFADSPLGTKETLMYEEILQLGRRDKHLAEKQHYNSEQLLAFYIDLIKFQLFLLEKRFTKRRKKYYKNTSVQ